MVTEKAVISSTAFVGEFQVSIKKAIQFTQFLKPNHYQLFVGSSTPKRSPWERQS
jgi:hypothetical protein